MDSSQIGQLIFILILIALSAFFSSSETALVTVNKIRMRTLAEAGDKRAKKVLKVIDDSGRMLSAILIGNNIVNIAASSLATTFTINLLTKQGVESATSTGAGIATGVLTFIILIFGEISPKTMATIKADKLALAIAGPIHILMIVLTPIIYIINLLSRGVLFLFRVNPKDADNAMTEEELRTIVDVGQETGVIEDEEREMIHNVFDFGDSMAKEVMIPRIDVSFVDVESTYEELLEIVRRDKFTRFPVYEDTTDNVIGILNAKDLLFQDQEENFSIRTLMRPAYFTYEHKNTSDLFIEMRKSSLSLAIVLDEYGVTAGIITLEDLLEEIVGEIRDEYDTDEVDSIIQIGEYEYEVLGSTNLDDVSQELDADFSSDDYDTLGGLCLELLDHLPEVNEEMYTEDGVLLKIMEVDKNRIEKVYIRLPESNNEDTNN